MLDTGFAGMVEHRIETAIATAQPITMDYLRARPFVVRLTDRILWLGSPYL